MIEAFIGLDPIRGAQVIVKALSYATVTLAAGSALFLAIHRGLDPAVARYTRRIAVLASAVGLALVGATLAGEALFLAGGDLASASDPFLVAVVLDAPFADAQAARALGYGLVAALALGSAGTSAAVAGAAALAASFAIAGHAAAEPRLPLAALIVAHVLAVSYWLGAFAPLARLARVATPMDAGRVSEAFGRNAVVALAVLILAGVALLLLIAPEPFALAQRSYGVFFGLKLAIAVGLISLGAVNKLFLSPALAAGRPEAARALRRSIAVEAAIAASILAVTATMTTLTSP